MFSMETGSKRKSINIRYTHGGGGNSPVTKGVIKTNRRAVVYPDANILLSGHIHESFCLPITRERLTDSGKVMLDEQLHIQIPSYKDETTGYTQGYAIEKEMSPKPVGAYWLTFRYDRSQDCVVYDATRAR